MRQKQDPINAILPTGENAIYAVPMAPIANTESKTDSILNNSYEALLAQREQIVEERGLSGYELILKKTIWFSKSQLSYEDFCEFPRVRNNFHIFFTSGFVGKIYQSQEFYKRFAQENPDLSKELPGIFEGNIYSDEAEENRVKFYRAYCIMLSYPEVINNAYLFR